jgi:hypothetical protein
MNSFTSVKVMMFLGGVGRRRCSTLQRAGGKAQAVKRRRRNGLGARWRMLWETRRRLVLLAPALVAIAAAAGFYVTSVGEEEVLHLPPPPVTDFSCTVMTVRAEDGAIQCFDGRTIALAGILYRAEQKAPLELLVIGDALQCRRIGRHESGATLARCTTSDGVDLACAMDPANIAARDVRSLCLRGGAAPLP